MQIVIAPDKFKGTLLAREVADAMAAGVRAVVPDAQIDLCPLSDGGEGFVEALINATHGTLVNARVTGPLPEMKVDSTYGLLGTVDAASPTTAVIEMSAASGLSLLSPDQYDPLATTTFGTGELIAHAIHGGAKQILLGIGGSATIDAGIGAAHACGFTILMRHGEPTPLSEPLCGRDVEQVLMVKHGRGEVTNGVTITVACDVTNPLFGPQGAAKIYGPQKGASAKSVEYFDRVFADFVARTGTQSAAETPGAGAAGGLGFGLLAFFGAELQNGFDIVARATQLQNRLANATLVLTGEGRFDASSLHGKVAARVANLAHDRRVDCIAICGDRESDLRDPQFTHLASLTDVVSKEIALGDTRRQLAARTASVVERWLKETQRMR